MSREDYECGINNLKLDTYSQVEYNRKKNVEQDKSIAVVQSKINELINQRPSGFLPRVYYGLTRGINTYRFNIGTRLNIEGIQGEVGDAFEFVVPSEIKNYITAVGVMVGENQIEITVQGDYDERFTSFDLVNMRTGALLENADLGNVLVNQNASYLGDYNANENINKQITVLYDLQSNEENIIFASVDFSGDEKYNWVRIGGYSNGVNGKSMYCIKASNIDDIVNKAMVGDNLLAGEAFIYITYNFQIGDLYVIDNKQPFTLTKIGNLRGAQGPIGATGPKGDNGEDGVTPTIVDNYWYINGESTNVRALAIDGMNGLNGQSFSMVSELHSTDENYGKTGNVGPNGETLAQLPALPQSAIGGKSYIVYDPLTTPLNPFYDLYYANNGDANWTIIHPFSPIRGNDGINGNTPYIVNGFWHIDGVNTGVSAKGLKGDKGDVGPVGPQGPQGDPIPADTELDKTSINAVENRVIATKIEEMDEQIATNEDNIQLAPIKNQNNTYTGENTFEYGNGTVIDISDAGLSVQNGDGKKIYITPSELIFEDTNKPHGQVVEYEQAELLVNEYDKTLNLLNIPNKTITNNGITITQINGKISLSGTATNNFGFSFSENVKLKPNTTYTYVIFNKSNLNYVNLYLYDYDKNRSYSGIDLSTTLSYVTFTTPNEVGNNIKLDTYFNVNQTYNNSVDIMLIEGTKVPTKFTKFNGPIVHQNDIESVLLWKNGSPNADFANQTISVPNLINYKYMILKAKNGKGNNDGIRVYKFENRVNDTNYLYFMTTNDSNTIYIRTRDLTILNNQISFKEGKVCVNFGARSSDNAQLIPYEIYGTNLL